MQQLLKQCRYYQGESVCPESIKQAGKGLLWFYESVWVERDKGNYQDEDYTIFGLTDFATTDTTPLSLKKLLFNRFLHWSGYGNIAEQFKEWYLKHYIGNDAPGNNPVI